MRDTLLINIARWSSNACNTLNTTKKSCDVIFTPALKILLKKAMLMRHPFASELFCLALLEVLLEHYMLCTKMELQSHLKGEKQISLSL